MNLAETVDLVVNLKLNDEASAKIKSFGGGLTGLGTKMTSAGKTLTMGLTLPILSAAAGVVKLAVDAEETDARLSAAFKSMGADSWTSLDTLQKKADELMSKTTFDDDAVKDAQAVMLTFGNVTGEVFDKGIEAALNMSSALGTDVQSSVIQLGKALNDPIRGITALQRVGVSFTADQKEQIKVLVESGKTYEAQGVILAELNKEFGGMAEAAAKTSGGQMAQAMNELAEAGEEIGTLLLPVIKEVAGMVKDLATWFRGLSPEVKATIVQVAALAAVFGPVLFIGGKLIGTLTSLTSIVGKLGGAMGTAGKSGAGFNTALAGAGVAAGAFAAGVMIANEAGNELEGQYTRGTAALQGMTTATQEQIDEIRASGKTALERADALKFMGFWDTEASVALRTLGQEALTTADRLAAAANESNIMGEIASHIVSERESNNAAYAEIGNWAGTTIGVAIPPGAATGMAGAFSAIPSAWRELAAANVPAMGKQLTIGLSDSIRSSKGNVVDAMDDLKWAMLHPLEGAKALARIEGELTGNQLKAGLASQNPFIKAQAEQTRQDLIAEWEKISGQAYNKGVSAANQLESGLKTFTPVRVNPYRISNALLQAIAGGSMGGGGGRAAGGPVTAGSTYLIGEKGPELLHMGRQGGYIQPNTQGWQGGVSRQPIQVNITNQIVLNTRTIARELDRSQALTVVRPR